MLFNDGSILFNDAIISVIVYVFFFSILLTVYLSISLEKDQLDAGVLYFTLQYVHYNPLHVSSINAHHQEVNFIDAASGIVLSVSGRPVHRLREKCAAVLSQPVHRKATD